MARQKPISVATGARTKKEISTRIEVENKLQAGKLPATPPKSLSADQKKIYRWLYNTLSPTGYMSELDAEILIQGSIIIDRLRTIDRRINDDADLIFDREYRSTRDLYYKQFLKIAEQLCMSPQARAKMGTLIANTKEADPLADILEGGSDVQQA